MSASRRREGCFTKDSHRSPMQARDARGSKTLTPMSLRSPWTTRAEGSLSRQTIWLYARATTARLTEKATASMVGRSARTSCLTCLNQAASHWRVTSSSRSSSRARCKTWSSRVRTASSAYSKKWVELPSSTRSLKRCSMPSSRPLKRSRLWMHPWATLIQSCKGY